MLTRSLLQFALLSLLLVKHIHAQRPEIFVDIWRYQQLRNNSYQENPRVEIYLRIVGESLSYSQLNQGLKRAIVQVDFNIYRLEQTGDSVLVASDRYNLTGIPIPEDEAKGELPEIKHLQAYQLIGGKYHMSIRVADVHSPTPAVSFYTRDFLLDPPTGLEFAFSDVAFINYLPKPERLQTEKRPRLGKFFDPLITNNALINQDSLIVYMQLYNLPRLVTEGDIIERVRIMRQGETITKPYEVTEEDPENFQVFIHKFDIRDLFSDTYQLIIELVAEVSGRVLKSTSKKFYVYNSRQEPDFEQYVNVYSGDLFREYSEEELNYYISTLTPISNKQEIRFASVLQTYEQKRNYLFSFWNRRVQDDITVMELWRGYLAVLDYVKAKYRYGTKEGWQTDRGQVMLKHGPPNSIESYPATSRSMAYEIWRYDRLDNQSDVIFVFYRKRDNNNFELLHTDKYGEQSNSRWRTFLEIN